MKHCRFLGLTAVLLACSEQDSTTVLPPSTSVEPLAPEAPEARAANSSPGASTSPLEPTAPAALPLAPPAQPSPVAVEPAPPLANPVEPAPAAPGAQYVVATAVSTDSGANTYVTVLDSVRSERLDLTHAREFSGWSDLAVAGEWIFVSSGEAPVVSRFSVGEGRVLVDAGTISFGNYVSDANFYNQEVISASKAYLLGEGEIVVWNPSTLEITGTIALPELPAREGILPYIALDRGATVRDGKLYATVSWTDTQELNMLADSRILVVDVASDRIEDVLTVPCPDLNVVDQDELGNLYFSNWVYSPGATLLYGDSSACAVRIPAGSQTLDDWSLSYAALNGREGAVMAYLGQGKWLYSSFLGDPATYNPQTDDWFDWLFGDTWQLEMVDPTTKASTAITGLPKNGGGYYTARFDGVTRLLMPGDGYTTTAFYALGADGSVTRELDTLGWATRMFKLR